MNIKSAFNVSSPGKPHKLVKLPDVPNLMDWRKIYGSDDYEGNHTHKHTTKFGEYHIQPAKDKGGKVVGYHLQFAHTGEGKPGQGMWTDLGVHSHPGKAIASARKHHSAFSKQESLSEGEVKKANKAAKKEFFGAKKPDMERSKRHVFSRRMKKNKAASETPNIVPILLGKDEFKKHLKHRIERAKQARADRDRHGDAHGSSKI